MLLDQSVLCMGKLPLDLRSANSDKKSILIQTQLSSLRNPQPHVFIDTVSLVDSGSTAMAFADEVSIVNRYNVTTKKLLAPRPLRLADGIPTSLVTDYFTARMSIGAHTEAMLFFVTKLSPVTPIILGMPWLQKHEPRPSFRELRICFDSDYCTKHCLPWRIAAHDRYAPRGYSTLPSLRPRTPYRPPTVEDAPDEGEPTQLRSNDTIEDWTTMPTKAGPTSRPAIPKPKKKVRFAPLPPRTHRQPQHPLNPGRPVRHPSLNHMPYAHVGARVTAKISHGAETRMIETTPPQRPTSHPLPAHRVQGRRLVSALRSRPGRASPAATAGKDQSRPNLDDIMSVRAVNFVQFCKQKGVKVMRIHMAELVKLVEQEERRLLMEELPSGTVEIPDLTEESFRRLVGGEYTMEEARKVLPEYFHSFLEANLRTTDTEFLRRKVIDADVEKFMKGKPVLTREDILRRLPKEHRHQIETFLPKNADELPPHRPWDHKIELMPGKQPPYHKNRPLSPAELRCIKKWIDEMLDKGFIRESTSPAAAPLLLAAKPGGGVRICHDYRGLNNVTVKNRYPLPLIRETLDALCGAKFYTKLDVVAAFNRIRVAEGHEWLTAFITRFGLYEMLVTPFGLCNAPATFQNYINHVLHDALDDYCTAYLDDVLVFSKTRAEHTKHVEEVIRRLGAAGLQIDIGKSEFYTTKTKYLGLIISTEGMSMDPEKVQTLQAWASPTSVKELQQFLGFANFYRRFIQGYSAVVTPMTKLLRKDVSWSWEPEQAKSFETLKKAFTSAPVLAYYDYTKKTVVETDASNWASGGVLSQYGDDNKMRPVAFFSAKHSAAECNYEIYDKELLAIVKALEEWRPELQGTGEPFEIITDHKNLQTFMTTKQLNQRQVRWAEFLSQFNFVIVYRPGSKATLPDALSRLPGLKPADADDERLRHRNQVVLPPEKLDPSILEELLAESRKWGDAEFVAALDPEIKTKSLEELVRTAYQENELARDIIAALRDRETRRWPKPIRKILRCDKSECSIVDGLMYFRNRLFVPDSLGLRLEVVHRTHSAGPAGHPGRVKTLDLLNRTYWWPRMSQFTATFVKDCALCFRTKTPRSAPPGFLKPLELAARPWTDISIDYIVELPQCVRNGKIYRHILVVVDRLTKMRHFIPVTGLTTEELVDAFIDNVYKLHGASDNVVSDRGSQFVSDFWRRLSERLKTVLRPSSAFHPETDGQTEIVNASVNKYLRGFVSFTQDDWVDWLPLAEFAMNNQVNDTTGISPFFANYGFNPRLGIEPAGPRPPTLSPQVKKEFFRADAVANRFERILTQLKALARISQQRYEDAANTRRDEGTLFREGDMVMVSLENMKTNRPKKKWDDKWDGPFPVLKVYRGAVVVDLPDYIRVNKSFHTSKVRLWFPETLAGQERINAEERRNVAGRIAERDDDGNIEDRWEFEKILDVHDEDKEAGLTYLIKWKYHDEATWQPEEDLKSCERAVRAYHEQNTGKPGPPAWAMTKLAPRRRGRPRRS
jgi:RNase H-like domain found in reverse transcriptase/Reverse transcriptase (RNA-dependent DNA polymerase)/Integrase zinc binding domain/Chromo (CHRromatin Organisation MOdifier) domain